MLRGSNVHRKWSRTSVGAPKLHGSRARPLAIHSHWGGGCSSQSWQSLIRMLTHRAHRYFTICSTLKLTKRGDWIHSRKYATWDPDQDARAYSVVRFEQSGHAPPTCTSYVGLESHSRGPLHCQSITETIPCEQKAL